MHKLIERGVTSLALYKGIELGCIYGSEMLFGKDSMGAWLGSSLGSSYNHQGVFNAAVGAIACGIILTIGQGLWNAVCASASDSQKIEYTHQPSVKDKEELIKAYQQADKGDKIKWIAIGSSLTAFCALAYFCQSQIPSETLRNYKEFMSMRDKIVCKEVDSCLTSAGCSIQESKCCCPLYVFEGNMASLIKSEKDVSSILELIPACGK